MFKILFLEIVIMLKFISKKFDRFHQKMFSIIKWDVIFTTPFWKFLASNPNWYFVMEENYEPMVKKIIIDNVSKFYNSYIKGSKFPLECIFLGKNLKLR